MGNVRLLPVNYNPFEDANSVPSQMANLGMAYGLTRFANARRQLNDAWGAATLPGDVVTGKVDLGSPEGQKRALDLANLSMSGPGGGAGAASAGVNSWAHWLAQALDASPMANMLKINPTLKAHIVKDAEQGLDIPELLQMYGSNKAVNDWLTLGKTFIESDAILKGESHEYNLLKSAGMPSTKKWLQIPELFDPIQGPEFLAKTGLEPTATKYVSLHADPHEAASILHNLTLGHKKVASDVIDNAVLNGDYEPGFAAKVKEALKDTHKMHPVMMLTPDMVKEINELPYDVTPAHMGFLWETNVNKMPEDEALKYMTNTNNQKFVDEYKKKILKIEPEPVPVAKPVGPSPMAAPAIVQSDAWKKDLVPFDWTNYFPNTRTAASAIRPNMSAEARARAQAMGVNPNVLMLKGLSTPWRGVGFEDPAYAALTHHEPGIFAAHDPNVSNAYTPDPEFSQIVHGPGWIPGVPTTYTSSYKVPFLGRGENPLMFDWEKAQFKDRAKGYNAHQMSALIAEAQARNADMLLVKNVRDIMHQGYGLQDQYVFLQNKGHRVPWAAFNYADRASEDLLKSGGMPGFALVPVAHNPFEQKDEK